MPERRELLYHITRSLLRGEWLTLYGPRGIGKQRIVENVQSLISVEHGDTHLPLILSLSRIDSSSVEEVERGVLHHIAQCADLDYPGGIDFLDRMENILQKVPKRVVMLLSDVDIISHEGAFHIAGQLRTLYHSQKGQQMRQPLTVMLCGGVRLSRLAFGKTSPFNHARPIRVGELDEEQAREWIGEMNPKLPNQTVDILYNETGGYPALLKELVQSISEKSVNKDAEVIVDDFIGALMSDDCEIKSDLFQEWFSHIDRPEFLHLIRRLLGNELVTIRSSQLPAERIEVSGFLRTEGEYVKFRNPLTRRFTKRYATPRRIADHFWLFSSRHARCWEEGCSIYQSLPEGARLRTPDESVGPVYKTLSDLVTACGSYVAGAKQEIDIWTAIDNILGYLFNVKEFLVCEEIHRGTEYQICYAPKDSSLKSGDKLNRPEVVGLAKICLSQKGDWAHAWNYAYIAFPLIRGSGGQRQMVLWIDNRAGKIKKEHNAVLASLASRTGLALLQLEQREYLLNELDLLNEVLKYDEDYVQVVDMKRRILMLNPRSQENAKNWRPDLKDFTGIPCPVVFRRKKKQCYRQCACLQVFRDRQPHRRSEVWTNPKDKSDKRYMDVIAVPFERHGQMFGTLQVARDVTLLRRAMEAMIDFSSVKTEEEVFAQLLSAVAKQGARRVRLYLPSEEWDIGLGIVGDMISKDCTGYEDDPQFVTRFRDGQIELDGSLERYWIDVQRKIRKPVISRINTRRTEPVVVEDGAALIFEVPPKYDTRRKDVKKEKVNEWICMGLFAGDEFFGMISVDKGYEGGKFRIIECDRMLAICRSAASALARISVPDIESVVRIFRHTISQQLDVINHYIGAFAERNLPKDERETYAKLVDGEFQRFERFSRNMTVLLPEMDKPPIQYEDVNVTRLAQDIRTLFQYYCDRARVKFSIDLPHGLVQTVRTDEMMVRIILCNLLDNAFKALERCRHKNKEVCLRYEDTEEEFIVAVIDNGPGIAPDDRRILFRPGPSGKTLGTGIGLPASKLVANWIGAEVRYDPEHKGGARFNLAMPKLRRVNHG